MSDFDDFKAGHPDDPEGGGGGNAFLKYCLICGCLAILAVGGAGGFFAYQMSKAFMLDPVKVEANMKSIVDSEVPDGYSGMFGLNMAGVKMSVIGPTGAMTSGNQNPPLMIVVFQLPPGQNPELAKAQMKQQLAQQQGGAGAMMVESEGDMELMIRGQKVTAQEAIGTNNGLKQRQVFVLIDRSSTDTSQVMLMFMGNADEFDQEAMDAFLESIK